MLSAAIKSAAFAMLGVALACSPKPPEADQRVLEQVQQRVDDRMVLGLERELYVTATLRPDARISRSELDSVYRAFFFLPDGRRRDSRYFYLNVYDADKRFLFQLAYNARRGEILSGRTEHY